MATRWGANLHKAFLTLVHGESWYEPWLSGTMEWAWAWHCGGCLVWVWAGTHWGPWPSPWLSTINRWSSTMPCPSSATSWESVWNKALPDEGELFGLILPYFVNTSSISLSLSLCLCLSLSLSVFCLPSFSFNPAFFLPQKTDGSLTPTHWVMITTLLLNQKQIVAIILWQNTVTKLTAVLFPALVMFNIWHETFKCYIIAYSVS